LSVVGKIKAALAANETLRKELLSLEADLAELAAVQGKLDATNAAIAEQENRLEQIRAMVIEADAKHSAWCEATTRERARVNAEIDGLQGRLAALEAALEEKQAHYNSIVGGMRALQERLGV
jgi:chromosome segregation ATPase